MKLNLTAFFLLLLLCSFAAQAQNLALTFDDGLNPQKRADATAINDRLLAHLKAASVKAMIFPALAHTGEGEGKLLVSRWSSAGHAVGNHTSKHRSLSSSKLSLNDFLEDVMEADAAFRGLPTWLPMIRFPYLKEGNTPDKRDGMRLWMAAHGYAAAPVSIDTSDWYYDTLYLRLFAAGDASRLAVLQKAYVEHLLDRARYYDNLAVKLLGRSPSHVMLLHVNAINAAWLPEVLAAFKAQKWTLVSPVEAFKDALYRSKPHVLPAGESIVWSLAKEQGQEGLRYPAEDSVYEEGVLRALGLLP